MCGIAGIIYSDKSRRVERSLLESMTDVMRYRGPDDAGVFSQHNFGLGHRRLAVIDREGGHQPMVNDDGTLWITYNGEIYNFLELRKELVQEGCTFRSHSDTEVLLRLYERRGTACLKALNGMFSFAILDLRRRKLFAARDRFGIKPFYFFHDSEKFLFASEIKAILRHPHVPREPDYAEMRNYLTYQFPLGEETFFKKINRLLPGHLLEFDLDGNQPPRKAAYWDLDFENFTSLPPDEIEEKLLWLLRDAVRLQLRSDVPLGSHLSGGIDSSVITGLATEVLRKPIKTFTGRFQGGSEYDETPFARHVASHFGCEYHEVEIRPQDFVDTIASLAYFMDEPTAGPGILPQYLVSKLAREKVTVVLGGQGGDEVFGGYARYLMLYFEECLKGAIFETQTAEDRRFVVTFESILPNLPTLKEYVPLMKHLWRDELFEDVGRRYSRLLDRSEDLRQVVQADLMHSNGTATPQERFAALFGSIPAQSLINRMIHFDLKTFLPSLLQVEDRVSMACSLESRVPLLDHRLAEFMARVPPKVKFRGGRTKHLFREAVHGVIPEKIYNRKDKKGFPVPLAEWFSGPLHGFVVETLLGRRARQRGLYNASAIEQQLHREKKFGRHIWGLLNLELWFQTFQDSTSWKSY